MTALVDSCIGGKTGINHNKQINLIGTYFHPTNVIIYEKILDSIPSFFIDSFLVLTSGAFTL